MNVEIEFIGFPTIYDIFQEGYHACDFSGNSLWELIEDLIDRYGARVKESLMDPKSQTLDPALQIMINQQFITEDDFYRQKIEGGDKITFLRLLAGG